MRWGLTTGTSATAATKAALLYLVEGECDELVTVTLPDGESVSLEVHDLAIDEQGATASVYKDAGDDPDVTHGIKIYSSVRFNDGEEVRFFAGAGVGTVTRPGLAIEPGGAAINPGPREMIRAAVREVTQRGVDVTISAPEGLEKARKTFNPRLGIEGGISILGTTGRVRPFSAEALRDSLVCNLDVAIAGEFDALVLAPGNMGNEAALTHYCAEQLQIVDVSNEWGFMLERVQQHPLKRLLIVGHPGKLGKLAMGQWQTHSSFSTSAVPFIEELGADLLPQRQDEANTVEELFMQLLDEPQRSELGDRLSRAIVHTVEENYPTLPAIGLVLINLKREIIGRYGALESWSKK